MSWESTNKYIRIMNELVRRRLGGLNSAKIIAEYVNFFRYRALQQENRWEELSWTMIYKAQKLETARADCIIIATNTMPQSGGRRSKFISIPP